MATWVYKMTEPGLFTVGFYSPAGKWFADADFSSRDEARARVIQLNGGDVAVCNIIQDSD